MIVPVLDSDISEKVKDGISDTVGLDDHLMIIIEV